YTGMAAGVDIIAAEIVLEYQKKYTDLELLCIIPFHAQYSALKENMWRVRYKNIIAHETKHIILSEDYYDGCFLDRNRYMVDNTSRVIAVWNGQSSGTSATVRYGQRTGREVKIISI
ncbi:MAG: SLOG family protein, partial [Oscillospiraceae bacterium]